MRTIGFVISHKNNEQRRAVLPEELAAVRHCGHLYFESGYGAVLGYSDEDYAKCGVHIVTRKEALECDVITDVKLGDADYLEELGFGKILFGWAHAVQGIAFTDSALAKKHTVIAWEEIFVEGRYLFYRNREIAGEAAMMHAFRYCGKMPYDAKVAVLGNGQTAKGALRVLHGLGAEVDVYGRKLEKQFQKQMYDYDVLVNCVLWDTGRKDRIIYKEDLKKMRTGTLIVDISCDEGLEIETSHPTTIDDPVYEMDGVIHYAVDNTPAMYPKTTARILSRGIAKYLDAMAEAEYPEEIKNAIVVKEGSIIDDKIRLFREKKEYRL